MLAFSTNSYAQGGDPVAGEKLFKSNCAACHKLDKKATGPALRGVAQKYDVAFLHKWIKDSQGLIKSGDATAVKIFEENNKSIMTSFPQLSDADIDNILAYTSQPKPEPKQAETATSATTANDTGATNTIILVALVMVFLLLVVLLFLVNKTLRKIAQANGVDFQGEKPRTSLCQAFLKNQFLLVVTAIVFLLVAAYLMFGYFMQVGVDQGYQPVQPIHYSHKIHAGDNKIDCNYCHSSARRSKTSGVPSLNVCMNCHKNISEVAEDTATEEYSKEFYDGEIAKLYDAVGWNPDEMQYTGETKPVRWVRIHNLPDFVYFNHSQHVTVAGVACQKCHGPVEEMEIMEQFAPLTMGWCINCHKDTNVKLKDNKYYEKIHEELSKKYGIEKLTAAEMGGMECGKCHY
jgi:mono/diheme cytochrome c family protein